MGFRPSWRTNTFLVTIYLIFFAAYALTIAMDPNFLPNIIFVI